MEAAEFSYLQAVLAGQGAQGMLVSRRVDWWRGRVMVGFGVVKLERRLRFQVGLTSYCGVCDGARVERLE